MTQERDVVGRVLAELEAEAERVRAEVRMEREALDARLAPLEVNLARLQESVARLKELEPTRRPPARGKRAPRGTNHRAILAALEERPGQSAAQIAEVTHINPKVVGTTLAKLARQGVVKRTRRAKRRVTWRLAKPHH